MNEKHPDEIKIFHDSVTRFSTAYKHAVDGKARRDSEIHRLQKQLQAKTEELKCERAENEKLRTEAGIAKDQACSYQIALQKVQDELSSLQKEVADRPVAWYKIELGKKTQELNQKIKENHDLQIENANLQERMDTVTHALAPFLAGTQKGLKRERTKNQNEEDPKPKFLCPRSATGFNAIDPHLSDKPNDSAIENEMIEQEREGQRLEISISSLRMLSPASLLSPLPEMSYVQQKMDGKVDEFQMNQMPLDLMPLSQQLELSIDSTSCEAEPKADTDSSLTTCLEDGEIHSPVVEMESSALESQQPLLHRDTQVGDKITPVPQPKKPKSSMLNAAMSKIKKDKLQEESQSPEIKRECSETPHRSKDCGSSRSSRESYRKPSWERDRYRERDRMKSPRRENDCPTRDERKSPTRERDRRRESRERRRSPSKQLYVKEKADEKSGRIVIKLGSIKNPP